MSIDSRRTLLRTDAPVLREEPRAEPVTAAVQPDEPINILLVDDEPKNLTVLESVLENPRYRLVRAESADEALISLVAEEFALLVLDIQMPGMNGFELAQMVKQRKKTADIPIIFLTAYYSEDQHILEGYSSGAVDYLHKPINSAILRSKVAVFADLHCKSREIEVANRALLAEIEDHRRSQEELRQLTHELEQRVAQRTTELVKSNVALQESESRLKLAIRNSRILLYTTDRELRCTWISDLRSDFVSEEAVGRRPDELFPAEQAASLIEIEQRVLNSGIGERGGCTLKTAGRQRYYDLTVEPLKCSEVGQIVGVTVAAMEITELKEAEAALKQADRQKDEFLATLAHELRNPLAPIRNAVQILHLKGPDTPEIQWAREVIDRQAQQMTRLVDDLLDISRITTGKLALRKDSVELEKIIHAAVETSRPLVEQCGQQLSVALPREPVMLSADLTRLAQVLSNLLNNAAKYTERGGQIGLTAEREGDTVVVSVKDNGIGISAEMLPYVFEMFTQGERQIERSQGGLGIGLTLVKRLVELHGGGIEARSEGTGKGSEFVVRLPALVDSHLVVHETGEGKIATFDAQLRILVADDNADSADSLRMLLRLMGHDVRVAGDGMAAVRIAESFRPDVALLDIGMPQLNGYDTCRRIREQPWGENVLLIAQTGWGQEEDRRRTREAGFDHHLVKPVDHAVLMKVLAEVTSQRKQLL